MKNPNETQLEPQAPLTRVRNGNPQLLTVIATDIELRGSGTETDPLRRVEQFFSVNGDKLAEVDPCQNIIVEQHIRRRVLERTEALNSENLKLVQRVSILEHTNRKMLGKIAAFERAKARQKCLG